MLLIASDLVSHADRHAGGVSDFHVWHLAGCVAAEVSDRSSLFPGTPETPLGAFWYGSRRSARRKPPAQPAQQNAAAQARQDSWQTPDDGAGSTPRV
ncbi:hypothetical protein ACFYYB_27750 [Streptomyces sp. NPDC002886]|uniref:hypothetical protein n=1 Tax=Streptomyces sp. NPDC002886 TaxID=3364667 RepID=UPI0036BF193A